MSVCGPDERERINLERIIVCLRRVEDKRMIIISEDTSVNIPENMSLTMNVEKDSL